MRGKRDTEIGKNARLGISLSMAIYSNEIVKAICFGSLFLFCTFAHTFVLSSFLSYNIAKGGRKTMKEIKRRLVLDDFEYRLLVGCVNKARTMFLDEGKPIEDVSALLLKIIDAPTKKIKVRS